LQWWIDAAKGLLLAMFLGFFLLFGLFKDRIFEFLMGRQWFDR
jgi:hypothetical protein